MTREDLIKELIHADGAILYWQVPKDAAQALIAESIAYIADDDCLVLQDAIKIGDGAYTLQRD